MATRATIPHCLAVVAAWAILGCASSRPKLSEGPELPSLADVNLPAKQAVPESSQAPPPAARSSQVGAAAIFAPIVQTAHFESPETTVPLPPGPANQPTQDGPSLSDAAGKQSGQGTAQQGPSVATGTVSFDGPMPNESGAGVKLDHANDRAPATKKVAAADKPEQIPTPPRPVKQDQSGDELTLEEAIRITLAENPDLQSATDRARYAYEVLNRANADFYPVLAFNQEYQVSDNPLRKFSYELSQGGLNPMNPFGGPSSVDNFHTQIHLQQDIYSGGARLARSRSAAAENEASHFALAVVQNQIAFQVAEAYYRLFQARELVKVRHEAVNQVEKQLQSVQARFRAQTATRSDVLQVEVRLAEVEESFISARNRLALSWAILENVTGVSLSARRLPEVLPAAPWSAHVDTVEAAMARLGAEPSATNCEAAVAEALQSRPELGEIESHRVAAEQRVRAAEAGKRPTIGAVVDYDVNYPDFTRGNESYYIGLAFSLNLFDAGRTKANVRQYEAQVHELIARNRRAHLDIELDVRRAVLQLADSRERVRVATAAVRNAQEALRRIDSQYDSRTATVTQLIDAQVALSDVQVRLTNARAEVEVSRASLERAVGRLTTFLAPAAECAHAAH